MRVAPEDDETEEFSIESLPWFECLEILLHDFVPANNSQEADLFWSTNEIANAVANHFGIALAKIDRQDVYQAMLYKEYSYTRSGEMYLEWMLRQKISTKEEQPC